MKEVVTMTGIQKTKRIISCIMALFLGLSCAFYHSVPVQAAVSYQGHGTKNAPYLVETAAQLDGIRNNLAAHYKLSNTIDMSSYGTFEPIGYEGAKFTGSFICDKNSDGTPKYAIKNLKVYIDAGEKYGHKLQSSSSYVDYVEGNNKWQAGLFGWTDGATIENIAVLNADVTNTVVGQNSMNNDYSMNPGQNYTQSAGVLIGTAINTTVYGCSSTGNVRSKSNYTGGLIGYTSGGSISNSYSKAKVTSSGYWSVGGLIGGCESDLSCCFATGDVQGNSAETQNAGFVGSISEGGTTMIVSCYSTGNVSPSGSGFSFVGYRTSGSGWKSTARATTQNMVNCYTTGNVVGYSSVQAGNTIEGNNNYILSSSTGNQECFKAASMDEIKAGLSSSGDYDVSGSAPILKNVAVIADESKYVPGAISDVAQNATSTPSNEITGESDGSNTEGEATISAEQVSQMIEALPVVATVTIEYKEAVKEAKRAYDSLLAEQKIEVSSELVAKLTDIYNQMVLLIIKDISSSISELPKAGNLTMDDYDTVMAIYDDFQFIGDDNQEYVKEELKEKLLEAVEVMKNLKNGGNQIVASDSISPIELLFIIVLSVLIVLVLAFNVIWSIVIIKKNRKLIEEMNGDRKHEAEAKQSKNL